MKTAAAVVFASACALLYYGCGMLLLVPGRPGEAYLATPRLLYGAVPALLGVGLLSLAARLWVGVQGRGHLRKALLYAFSLGFATVIILWVVLLVTGVSRAAS
jgi:hypothetical protein